MVAGRGVDLRLEFERTLTLDGLSNAMSLRLGTEPPEIDDDELIAEAGRAAADSDVALFVVGTNSEVESEGYERPSLALPGRQDDLVRAVAAANPHTVVLVNAGAPVLMPWRHDVAAVLVGYFGARSSALQSPTSSSVSSSRAGVCPRHGRSATTRVRSYPRRRSMGPSSTPRGSMSVTAGGSGPATSRRTGSARGAAKPTSSSRPSRPQRASTKVSRSPSRSRPETALTVPASR